MPGILFDARVLRPGMTGIGNYAYNLLRAMPVNRTAIGILLPAGSPFSSDFPGCRIHFTRVDLTAHPLTGLYEQFVIPVLCRHHGYGSFVSFEGRIPVVRLGVRAYPFVYDLAYKRVPGSHNIKYTTLLRLSQWVARHFATRVVTISASVQRQIVAAFRLPVERVLLAYPSDSGLIHAPLPSPGSISAPYLLAVSMTNPRKNLGSLLKAFDALRQEQPELRLVVTGNAGWIEQVLRETGVEGVVNAGFVEEGELGRLYANAAALVYPSLDEGFGIPLLDAALFGCPVACSDIPVFREVLADEARYFDPGELKSMTAAMRLVLSNPVHADAARVRARFSWERSAFRLVSDLLADQGARQVGDRREEH